MKRIQIQLTGKRLDDLVNEMAVEASKAAMQVMKTNSSGKVMEAKIRNAIREVLKKYVHAYDVCGLAAVCQEATELDPWALKDQDQD